MAWFTAFLRFLFPALAAHPLLRVAYGSARMILDILCDPKTGAINHDTCEGRRMAAQRLHDCETMVFLAIDDRARTLAGLPQTPLTAADMRLSELTMRNVCVHSLIRRARQVISNIKRFEQLSRRRAERLKRHAERQRDTRHASNLGDILVRLGDILGILVPFLVAQNQPQQVHHQAKTGADAHIRAPP